MEIQNHLYTIREVKKYLNNKDFEGLKKYIEQREIDIMNLQDEDKSSEYVEELVKNLS
ncbi:MAG TPA: hypothetical protein OIM50_04395 [Clostridiaceae bacterium]|jgi:hypothetical protein|nr:MAG TPA: hypothetical protein [Caudoviricetes sp.]HJJ09518.1 hypothetical protein [Clostridiaceae bacterium]